MIPPLKRFGWTRGVLFWLFKFIWSSPAEPANADAAAGAISKIRPKGWKKVLIHRHVVFDYMSSLLAVREEWRHGAGVGKDMSEECRC